MGAISPLALALIGGATTAVSGVMSATANNRALAAQQKATVEANMLNQRQKQQEANEVARKTGMDLTAEHIKRIEERGRIKAAQAESGVAGASPLREFANTYVQEQITKGGITEQGNAYIRTIGSQQNAMYGQAVSQVNALESQKQDSGSILFGSILKGAMTGLSIYGAAGAAGLGATTTTSATTGALNYTPYTPYTDMYFKLPR